MSNQIQSKEEGKSSDSEKTSKTSQEQKAYTRDIVDYTKTSKKNARYYRQVYYRLPDLGDGCVRPGFRDC